jgi:hypothetical protein
MCSQKLIDSLRACIDTGYIPNSDKTAALTAALFTNQNTFSNRHLLHAIDKKNLIKDIYTIGKKSCFVTKI